MAGSGSKINWLYKGSAAIALGLCIYFLAAAFDPIFSLLQANGANGYSLLPDNWLVVIFKLLAGFGGTQVGQLQGVNALDLILLALIGLVYVGLFAVYRKTAKAWALVAMLQPFLGIILFLTTQTAGRSAVMGAGLVISIVMLVKPIFSRATALTGLLASLLLGIGDLNAGGPPSSMLAVVFGVGYVFLIAWFFMVGRRLLRMDDR